MVAAAGVVAGGLLQWDTPDEHLETLFDVNVRGVWNTAAVTVPVMLGGPSPSQCRFVAVASAAGVRRGAIHVFSFCRLAVDQANNFVVTVPRVSDALPAAVDIDFEGDCDARPDRAVVVGEVARFLKIAENHTGKPMLLMISREVEGVYRLSAEFERPEWSVGNFFPPEYAAKPWAMWRAIGEALMRSPLSAGAAACEAVASAPAAASRRASTLSATPSTPTTTCRSSRPTLTRTTAPVTAPTSPVLSAPTAG